MARIHMSQIYLDETFNFWDFDSRLSEFLLAFLISFRLCKILRPFCVCLCVGFFVLFGLL